MDITRTWNQDKTELQFQTKKIIVGENKTKEKTLKKQRRLKPSMKENGYTTKMHKNNQYYYIYYFLSNFYFSQSDSPSKTMKNVFYFI